MVEVSGDLLDRTRALVLEWAAVCAADQVKKPNLSGTGGTTTAIEIGVGGQGGAIAAPTPPPPEKPIKVYSLATREDVIELQTRLSELGYLDPPADGAWGPVSKWALATFCDNANEVWLPNDKTEFSVEINLALNHAQPLPLNPGDDFAGRIVKAMQKHGYWIARSPECVNVVYVEGVDVTGGDTIGSPNANRPNAFDDARIVFQVGKDGVPRIIGAWEATTEPGKYWTDHPMNPDGAFHIKHGQYKAWVKGWYHTHEAWVEAGPLDGYRDPDKTDQRDFKHPVSGEFGVHQHWGYNYGRDDMGKSSAGCLVGRLTDGHLEFMKLTKADARAMVNPAYRIMTAILPAV